MRTIAFVHDLESVRAALKDDAALPSKMRMRLEETAPLKSCDVVVAHNPAMVDFLSHRYGIARERIVSLGIFDYLYDGPCPGELRFRLGDPMVICGTLRRHKAGYVYELPEGEFNLYGVGYEGAPKPGVSYKGSFEPVELPAVLEGSFGLVWDGSSAVSCKGAYGEYLKVNNPHKTSMYLAMGMPVAIWDQAALADFVVSRGVGIVGGSIAELVSRIEAMSLSEYEELKLSAIDLAAQLKSGRFAIEAMRRAIELAEVSHGD